MNYKYSLEELQKIAENMADNAVAPSSVLLYGGLGSGKTTFSQFFIKRLMIKKEPVTSPTFNIIQIYDTLKGPIWHIDLYRIENPDREIPELGLIEAMHKYICIIEWPNIIDGLAQNCNTTSVYL